MEQSMKKFYDSKKSNWFLYLPKEGNVVAVHCVDSKLWYRARITNVHVGSGTVKVYLVDYGTEMDVTWKNVRRLTEKYLPMESQAVCVKLTDIEPVKESWSSESIAFLKKYQTNKTRLKMVINKVTEPPEVAIFEPYATVNICINATLVHMNLAISTGEM